MTEIEGRSDRRPNRGTANARTLALLSFAMLIVSLDQYIVVVALPEIGRALGYSAQSLQSVVSAYAVASSGFLLFGGRAADLLGRRRILITGLALSSATILFILHAWLTQRERDESGPLRSRRCIRPGVQRGVAADAMVLKASSVLHRLSRWWNVTIRCR